MRKFVALAALSGALAIMPAATDAAQKKPANSPQAKPKVNYYKLCQQLVAKHGGPVPRVQRYRVTKDGTLHCWYMA